MYKLYAFPNDPFHDTFVGSLLIDMSAEDQTTPLGRHIDQPISQLSADILTDYRQIPWSIYRPMLDRYVGRYVDQHISVDISAESTDCSADLSVECPSIYPSIYWSWGAQNAHDPLLLPKVNISIENHVSLTHVNSGVKSRIAPQSRKAGNFFSHVYCMTMVNTKITILPVCSVTGPSSGGL